MSGTSVPAAPGHTLLNAVWIDPYAWLKITYLLNARGDSHEFTFFGIHAPDAPWYITDIWIPKQNCSGSHTSPDRTDIALWLVDNPQAILYWCHTHPDMAASPSGDDISTLDHFTNNNRPIAMMIFARNAARDITCRLRFPVPQPLAEPGTPATFLEQNVTVHHNTNPKHDFFIKPPVIDLAAWLAELDSKVSPIVYSGSQYSGSRGYWRNARDKETGRWMQEFVTYEKGSEITVVQGHGSNGIVQAAGTDQSSPAAINARARARARKKEPAGPTADTTGPISMEVGGQTPALFPHASAVVSDDARLAALIADGHTHNENHPSVFLEPMDVAIAFIEDNPTDPSWEEAAVAYWTWEREKRQATRECLQNLLSQEKLNCTKQAVFTLIPLKNGRRYEADPMRKTYFNTLGAPLAAK